MIVTARWAILSQMAKVQPQGQKPAKNNEAVAVAEPEDTPFRYYVPGEKPRLDQAYFELLLLKVMRSTGDIAEFEEVWPRAVQALAGMNLLRLSTYGPGDVREAIGSVGGEFSARMSGQTEAIIRWAESFWRIRQIYGTFRQYVRSFEVDGLDALLEDLKLRLPGLSAEFLTGFLRDAGEKVPVPEKPAGGRQQPRPTSQAEPRGGEQRGQKQQPQPKQENAGGDRRRRQRGRGGARPAQQPQQQPGTPRRQQQPQAVSVEPSAETQPGTDATTKDPQQQQRRRNRRRFFRRRRSSGDKAGGASAPPAAD